jgi:hypothetical protein
MRSNKHTIKMFKKYKILALLITLLTGSILSNNVLAGEATWTGDEEFKCRINYKQLRLINSDEENKKHTTEFAADNHTEGCLRAGENILYKIYTWLDESITHVVVDVTSNMQCSEREGSWWWKEYATYKDCDTDVAEMMAGAIVDRYPGQVDYTISLRKYLNKWGDPDGPIDPDDDVPAEPSDPPEPLDTGNGTCYLSYLGSCLIRGDSDAEKEAEAIKRSKDNCYLSYLGNCIIDGD